MRLAIWRTWCYFEERYIWDSIKNKVILLSKSVEKRDSNIAPFLFSFFSFFFFGLFFGLSFFYLAFIILWPFSFLGGTMLYWMMIIRLLFIYNSMIQLDTRTKMTLYECLRRCTGICNESRVTCMKELWMVALPQILCQLHDHAKQYDNDECGMMNGMVESCKAIYLGMAMEMP